MAVLEDAPQLLDPRQLAARLNITEEHARRMLRRGEIPGLKIGRDWRVSIEDLQAFVAHKSKATPTPILTEATTEETSNIDSLFAPPTAEEIKRRLAALEAFGSNKTTARLKIARPLTDDAVAQGYDERVAQLMEGHA